MSKATELISDIEEINERISLNEMACLCDKSDGYGLEIVIFSSDHPPAHMHVKDVNSGKKVGRVLIPNEEPKSFHDILPYEGEEISNKIKKIIFKILTSKDPDTGTTNLVTAKRLWKAIHKNINYSDY